MSSASSKTCRSIAARTSTTSRRFRWPAISRADRPRRSARDDAPRDFDNVAAYREFDPRYPIASRYVDEDFNRLWHPATLDGPRQSIELERARALRPIVDAADFLLDLHSMQHATAPLMLAGLLERSRE